MDEHVLNELLECSVCLERMDTSSKVLPCQHTFCRRCLEEILSTKNEIRCPECRTLVEVKVEDLPANILLIRLLEGMKSAQFLQQQPLTALHSSVRATNSTSVVRTSPIPKTLTSLPVACAKALFNYDAQEPGDLTFKKGDMILLRKKVDENWFQGELNSQHGFFPASYVQVITPLPTTVPQCKALYDFEINDENEKDCLTFRKDEIVTVIRRVDNNWVEGKLGDRIGIFPISFVEMNDPAKTLVSSSGSATQQKTNGNNSQSNSSVRSSGDTGPVPPAVPGPNGGPSPGPSAGPSPGPGTSTGSSILPRPQPQNPKVLAAKSQKRHSLSALGSTGQKSSSPQSQHRHSMEIAGNVNFTSSPNSNSTATVVTTVNGAPVASQSPPSVRQVQPVSPAIYLALYHYKPQKEDEVELHKGDYYSVAEKCQDGWFKGRCFKTGKVGVFPGNYVQLVKTPQLTTTRSPQRSSANVLNIRATGQGSAIGGATSQSPQAAVLAASMDYMVNRPNSAGSTPPPRPPHQPITVAMAQAARAQQAASRGAGGGSEPSSPKSTSSGATSSKNDLPIPVPPRTVSQASPPSPKQPSASNSTSAASGSASQQSVAAIQHSMSTSANITPPNVVVGASGVLEPMLGSGAAKEKEKKKEKEKMSLMKRLTSSSKGKKSKSAQEAPEGATCQEGASGGHSRTGSLPSEEGAVAPPPPQVHHKKTGSLDSSTTPAPKPGKPKPLIRERFRCIVPYPPQSDIELELKIGDIVYVHKKRDDGWFKGTLARTGKTGLFPGSFVESF